MSFVHVQLWYFFGPHNEMPPISLHVRVGFNGVGHRIEELAEQPKGIWISLNNDPIWILAPVCGRAIFSNRQSGTWEFLHEDFNAVRHNLESCRENRLTRKAIHTNDNLANVQTIQELV